MYGKFFASTFTGSMFGAGANVFAVWGYVIANTCNSQIELNPKLLAAILGTPEAEIVAAIDYLSAPDPVSRSKTEDGRRLIREGSFAYRVPNFATYRAMRSEEERREYNRVKKAEQREREKLSKPNLLIPMASNGESKMSAHTEAETGKSNTCVLSLGLSVEGTDTYEGILDEVWHYYIEKVGRDPRTMFTETRKKMGMRCLQYAIKRTTGDIRKAKELMLAAVDQLAASDYHNARGKHAHSTKYNDWENVFRTADKFIWWYEKELEA